MLSTWLRDVSRIAYPSPITREAKLEALAEAFARGGWEKVTRLYRDGDIPDERCWVRGQGWCLAYD